MVLVTFPPLLLKPKPTVYHPEHAGAATDAAVRPMRTFVAAAVGATTLKPCAAQADVLPKELLPALPSRFIHCACVALAASVVFARMADRRLGYVPPRVTFNQDTAAGAVSLLVDGKESMPSRRRDTVTVLNAANLASTVSNARLLGLRVAVVVHNQLA